MKTLLGYIGRDKHADSLVEKLMLRFETAATPAQWRNLAFCLTQVPHHLSTPVNTSSCEMHKHHHRLLLAAAGYLKRVASTASWLHANPAGCDVPTFRVLRGWLMSASSQQRLDTQKCILCPCS